MAAWVQSVRTLLVAAILSGGIAARGEDARRPRLYVYLHTEMKSGALGKLLQDKLPALTVTAFGRYQDFEEAIAAHRPEAVLAQVPLLESQNLLISLQGVRGGLDREPYVLVSNGELQGPLAGKTIGVVDLLGHDGTRDFVAALLKEADLKIKRVTKIEDLLPLLQFNAVDAVLLPAESVKLLTAHSRMPLKVRTLPDAEVGLPAVAILNPGDTDQTVARILELDADTKRVVGVDQWRKR